MSRDGVEQIAWSLKFAIEHVSIHGDLSQQYVADAMLRFVRDDVEADAEMAWATKNLIEDLAATSGLSEQATSETVMWVLSWLRDAVPYR